MTRYQGEASYQHGSQACTGVLVTNLGTPDAPTPAALRRYLAQFLWDPRVVEFPRPLWWLILRIILRIRPRRAARSYARVWTQQGSPLLVISRRQAATLQAVLQRHFGGPVQVALGMRYGRPSIGEAMGQLRSRGARRLLVLPLYPQYSAATTASTFDAVADVLKTWRWIPELRFVQHYHDDPGYIAALAASVREHWKTHGQADRLLFSFHGVPKRYLDAGDPYHCECQRTARLLADALELPDERWQLTFQSRFGREQWLQPYTDHTLKSLPGSGVRSVQVVCPGFSADCLETLEEIAEQNREFFLAAGGERYEYIPALNDRSDHIDALAELVARHTGGWPEGGAEWAEQTDREAREASRRRALSAGADR
ncbi:MAG: ferrochelatase [Gammaproteobacteria bacterium]